MVEYLTRRDFIERAARLGVGLAAAPLAGCLWNARAGTTPLKTVDEIDPAEIGKLANGLKGRLIKPADQDYEAARRVWNWAVDKRPGLIVQCAGAADISRTVQFARDRELLVAIRAGGHSLAGKSACDGGIMIDVSGMKKIQIDPVRRVAR